MSRLIKVILMMLFSLMLTIGCAATYNKISALPTQDQTSFFKDGRNVIVSRQANSIMTMAPSQEAFLADTRPSFIITVNNLSNQPITFSTENVAFSMDGKDLKVFSYQELVQEIEQQRRSAATTQALIGALGVLSATMDGGRTSYSGTYQSQNTMGTYSGTSYSPLATLQTQAAFSSMTSNNIAAINAAAEDQLNSVQNTVLRKETVLPNHWYGGYVRIINLPEPENPKSVAATVTFGNDVHQFTFTLAQDGQAIQKTQRTKGESLEGKAPNGTAEKEKRWAEYIEKDKKQPENGDPEAQFQLGSRYVGGRGVTKNEKEGANWIRRAAEQGHVMAQFELGELYSRGEGVPKDLQEAAKWYEKAAQQGATLAQARLGFMYKHGEGVKKDYDLATKWFKKLEDQNPQYAAAMGWTTGDLFNSIADRYYTGKGEPLDYVKAKYWYERSAAQGNLTAYCSLGMLYYSGEGVEKDYAKAMDWLNKAAERKSARAYTLLGMMYYNGEAVQKDYKKAADWFKKAADAGIPEAQYRLACMYVEGEGLDVNHVEAVKLLLEVAESPSAGKQSVLSQTMLGLIYAQGLGVEKNVREAWKWYSKAAEQGDDKAQLYLAELLEKEIFPGCKWITTDLKMGTLLINTKKIRRKGSRIRFWEVWVPYRDPNPEIEYRMAYRVADCSNGTTGLAAVYEYGPNKKLLASESFAQPEIQMKPAPPGSFGDLALSYVCSGRNSTSAEHKSRENGISFGTGWPVAGGYVVTNNHVVPDQKKVSLIRTDGTRISAQVVLRDKSNDLALVRPEDVQFLPPALPLSSSPVKTGAAVLTMGYPHPDILGSKPKLTEGIVSATSGAGDDPRLLQISVPVQAGNSGGPLINSEGEVVGIVMGKLDAVKMLKWTGDLPQNVNYAIKVSYLTGLLSSAPVKRNINILNMKRANSIEEIAAKIGDSILLVVAE
jgi:TPR repeat protein